MSRDDSWLRPKRYGETWPRFCAEVPAELAEELDEHIRRVKLKHGRFSRADAVRAGLRLYLEAQRPEPEAAVDAEGVVEVAVDDLNPAGPVPSLMGRTPNGEES